MARQIEIDTGLLQILAATRIVMQYHNGQIALAYQLFAYRFDGGVAHGRVHRVAILLVGAHIVEPHNLQAAVLHHFGLQHPHAHLPQKALHRVGAHIAVVVARHEIDGRVQLSEGIYCADVEVVGTLETVAGEKDDVRLRLVDFVDEPLHVRPSAEMSQVGVGKQHRAHGLSQVGQLHRHGREARHESVDDAASANDRRENAHDGAEHAGREMREQLHDVHEYHYKQQI